MKYGKAILLSIGVGVLLDIFIDLLIPDRVMNVVFVVTMSVLLLGILLVAFGMITKSRWGINLESVNCPACGSPMPKVRRPNHSNKLGVVAPAGSAAAKWTNGAA